MPKTLVIQNAFNRGELHPALFGRNDWQPYFSGAKLLRNMVCRTQGGAVKRAGTEFISYALDQTQPSTLIRFRYSVEQTYLLEFTDGKFRVFMDGGIVHYPAGHAMADQEVIIASPYSAEEMKKVRVAQTEDTMIFTHPNHRPRELTRKDHHIWEFGFIAFGASLKPPNNLRLALDGGGSVKYVVSSIAANGDESLPGDIKVTGARPGGYMELPAVVSWSYDQCRAWLLARGSAPTPGTDPYVVGPYVVLAYMGYTWWDRDGYHHLFMRKPDGTERGIYDTYDAFMDECLMGLAAGYGGILADARQRVVNYVTTNNNNIVYGRSTLVYNAAATAVRYRIYRSFSTDAGERFYPIGETSALTFTDDNNINISTETPQVDNNAIFTGAGNYPGVCLFFDQRLILARSDRQPNTVWGSRTGSIKNFNKNDASGGSAVIADTSAFEFTLQADEVNEILWGVSMDEILFGTAGGEFRMSGGGYAITPTNVNAKRQSNYGCSAINPVVIGQAVMGVGRKNKVLRAYQFSYTDSAYKGKNVSHYAGHLFNRREIVSLAYQYEPESTLWLVMSDGALLSCTYMNEEEVLGWARHDTDGGFEAVVGMTSVSGDEEIWFQALRQVNGENKRCIERMKVVQEEGDDIADAWYVDCGLALGAENGPRDEFPGLAHLEGKKVVCLGDGDVFTDLTVRNGTITLPHQVSKAVVGLPYAAELETVELEPMGALPISQSSKRPVTASILFYHSRECLYGDPTNPNEIKFRDVEPPGAPIDPKTIRKNVSLSAARKANNSRLWLSSPSPVPFGVLSVSMSVLVGDTVPNPGTAM